MVYLDADERQRFGGQTISFNFNHPIRELIWVVQQQELETISDLLKTLKPISPIIYQELHLPNLVATLIENNLVSSLAKDHQVTESKLITAVRQTKLIDDDSSLQLLAPLTPHQSSAD